MQQQAPEKGNFGVIWDLDGVLVDTGQFHIQSWEETLPLYGINFDEKIFRKAFGMNNASAIELFLGLKPNPMLVTQIADQKESAFRRAIIGKIQPLPGVLDWLETLKAEGIPMAIASSAPMSNIQEILSELKVVEFFKAILSGDEIPGKPDPGLFLAAARQLEMSSERCVVVEDAIAGVEAARRAGMKCIAVATTNPPEALRGANRVVADLSQLEPGAFRRLVNGGA